jgi:phosphate transport system protein
MDNKGEHISSQFDAELREVHQKVLSMGTLVQQQAANALDALLKADIESARKVIALDHSVNAYEVAIDEQCVTILARRQPTAGDLRCLMTVVKTITDLERIGDEAKNLAYQVVALENSEYGKYLLEIEHLGRHVLELLNRSMDIFEKMDASDVEKIVYDDINIDRRYANLSRQLITFMMEDPRSIPKILELMWVARALERMGDRSCNICNYVRYCVRGELVPSD